VRPDFKPIHREALNFLRGLKPTDRHFTYFIHTFVQHLSIKTDDGDHDKKITLTGKVLLEAPSFLVLLDHSQLSSSLPSPSAEAVPEKGPPFWGPLLEPMELVPGSGGPSRPLRSPRSKIGPVQTL
jgi:hypothetical protein